jgi:hypothetical protein
MYMLQYVVHITPLYIRKLTYLVTYEIALAAACTDGREIHRCNPFYC